MRYCRTCTVLGVLISAWIPFEVGTGTSVKNGVGRLAFQSCKDYVARGYDVPERSGTAIFTCQVCPPHLCITSYVCVPTVRIGKYTVDVSPSTHHDHALQYLSYLPTLGSVNRLKTFYLYGFTLLGKR